MPLGKYKYLFYTFFIVIILLCSSCEEMLAPAINESLTYLPAKKQLTTGIVAKYYIQQIIPGNDHPKMDIRYNKLQLRNDTLLIQGFDAGFTKLYDQKIKPGEDRWIIIENVKNRYGKLDTVDILDAVYLDWKGGIDSFSYSQTFEKSDLRLVQYQDSMLQSIDSMGRSKTFFGNRVITVNSQNGENIYRYKWERKYNEGLGMTQFTLKSEYFTQRWELVELINKEEFAERSNHGMQRVGYIDTSATMDDGSVFRQCHDFNQINDYYNGEDAGFFGGKGSIKMLLEKELDKSLLVSESGYLTFRFVINCQGEAGWFVTEEAGLDYQPKTFNNKLKKHLFTILKEVKEWNPLIVRGEKRDAYTYLTFKLKDGKIIEVLP